MKNQLIKEIAIECGYEYVQNFTRAYKKIGSITREAKKRIIKKPLNTLSGLYMLFCFDITFSELR
ncbi:hypothetical protein DRF60_19225 [Chryseobacterium elymi]|uniref:HTH araC/xylS-type domain-containing protein n=1 Tax=Chryseobacterium elymi TaxID=395936 RepID=A0A3D9D695_9FLAO|nr:hypothetical protein DRF60_19225 [Chryseobacterium elymi]